MTQSTGLWLVAAGLLACSCSSSDGETGLPASSEVTTPVASTHVDTTNATTAAATDPPAPAATGATTVPSTTSTTSPSTTSAAPPTTAALVVPIEVVDGHFVGLGYGSMLPDGRAALPQLSEPAQDGELPFAACTNSTFGHYWLTQLGGLALVWEGETVDQAHLTNWRYSGSEIDGVPLMTGLDGVTVGSTREAVLAAYASQPVDDLFDTILVDGSQLRFELEGDTVVAMSLIDCGD